MPRILNKNGDELFSVWDKKYLIPKRSDYYNILCGDIHIWGVHYDSNTPVLSEELRQRSCVRRFYDFFHEKADLTGRSLADFVYPDKLERPYDIHPPFISEITVDDDGAPIALTAYIVSYCYGSAYLAQKHGFDYIDGETFPCLDKRLSDENYTFSTYHYLDFKNWYEEHKP